VNLLEADDVLICLSDDIINFRKKVDPTYKSNRSGTDRPVYLYEMKDWLRDFYPSRFLPTLEADDVMGILSTEAHDEERIIVSEDKDMKTIPGLLYQPHHPELGIQEISQDYADFYHMYQTLIGDSTDGYPGCPGVGPKKAVEMLEGRLKYVPVDRVITRGKNKGEVRREWTVEPSGSQWETVVSCFNKIGLKEEDAIRQARLARILRNEDYNGRPVLWKPAEE
jgi:DNA polymerase-1